MSGCDLIVTAETGSGKTLAYVLPLLALLHVTPPAQQGTSRIQWSGCLAVLRACSVSLIVIVIAEGPVALIVVPVRELAEQIFHVIQDFIPQQVEVCKSERASEPTSEPERSKSHTLTSDAREQYPARRILGLVGGVPIDAQTSILARGVDVIVATPGRLLDFVSRRVVVFDRLRYLVFDEADRMLASDSGMEGQLRLVRTLADATSDARCMSADSLTRWQTHASYSGMQVNLHARRCSSQQPCLLLLSVWHVRQ